YREYSEPYFGKKKVLKGGAWTTRSRLIRATWRNSFVRHRRNVLAGFRTVARWHGRASGARRAERPDGAAAPAAAQVFLRCRRRRALRSHHRPAGVLPDPDRGGHP